MRTLRLRHGHVQPVWAGHPWVYAQAIEHLEGEAGPGDEVRVVDPRGQLLGRGFYTPASAIPVRILARDETPFDAAFFQKRVQAALELRRAWDLPSHDTTGYRVVYAEGDGLPGLIVDAFGDVLAVQVLTLGMHQRRGLLMDALRAVLHPRAIIDRTPPGAARLEGFTPENGVLFGEGVSELVFRERGIDYRIPAELGHKTGYYFDQRPLRARVEMLAAGRDVLDAYGFVGSMGIAAARGVARSVVVIEDSAAAIEAGRRIAEANNQGKVVRYEKGDALKHMAGAPQSFDMVIADPPRLAPTRKQQKKAFDSYVQIATHAIGATRDEGLTIVCSCSAAIDLATLSRAVALGAANARAEAVVLERLFQGPDHPVLAPHPEGLYLKSLLLRIRRR